MECHLRSYVNHFQDNWVDLLPMAEFAANANTSATTKIAPFMATKGYIPRMSFDPVDLSANSARERLQNGKARSIADDMKKVWDFVKEESTWSQQSQADAANRHRKDVDYDVGDMVWLSTKNIKTERPSKKLDHKMIGPYKIISKKGSSCQLDLPASMRTHNVFHTSLLRKAAMDPLPRQRNEPEPPVVINDELEWEVDDILDARRIGRSRYVQYRIKWKGEDEDRTWYPSWNFENAADVVKDFYDRNPRKPKDR